MTNPNEARMLLRMIAILAGALRHAAAGEERLPDQIGADIERVADLMGQKGPNGADEGDEIMRECERTLWVGGRVG